MRSRDRNCILFLSFSLDKVSKEENRNRKEKEMSSYIFLPFRLRTFSPKSIVFLLTLHFFIYFKPFLLYFRFIILLYLTTFFAHYFYRFPYDPFILCFVFRSHEEEKKGRNENVDRYEEYRKMKTLSLTGQKEKMFIEMMQFLSSQSTLPSSLPLSSFSSLRESHS